MKADFVFHGAEQATFVYLGPDKRHRGECFEVLTDHGKLQLFISNEGRSIRVADEKGQELTVQDSAPATYDTRLAQLASGLTGYWSKWERVVERGCVRMERAEAIAKLKELRVQGVALYEKGSGWRRPNSYERKP